MALRISKCILIKLVPGTFLPDVMPLRFSSTGKSIPYSQTFFVAFHAQQVTSGERLVRGYTKFDFTVGEGKGRLNSSRETNQGKHRRRKVEKSCVTLPSSCVNPAWYVHKSDVQNKWHDDNPIQTFFFLAGCAPTSTCRHSPPEIILF